MAFIFQKIYLLNGVPERDRQAVMNEHRPVCGDGWGEVKGHQGKKVVRGK